MADVSEAIMGAAYLTGGRDLGLQVIKDLGVPLSAVSQWSDFARQAVLPSREVTVTLKPGSLQAVENITGYKFKKPHLLAQALVGCRAYLFVEASTDSGRPIFRRKVLLMND